MKRKTIKIVLMIFLILVGGVLIGFGAFGDFSGRENSNISGIMMGLGAGLVGAAASQLTAIRIYTKNPKLLNKKLIEVTDERNLAIKNKAKSKVYDIYNLIFPMMIFVLVIANVNFILTGTILAIYGLRIILLIVYTNKYNKEM